MAEELKGLSRWALLIVSPVAWLSFAMMPYEVVSLAQRLSITEAQSANITSCEMLALSVLTWVSGRYVTRFEKRQMALMGILVALAGIAVSFFGHDYYTILVGKIILGAGGGIITAATNAIPALFKGPERLFAEMFASMAVMIAAIMYITPSLAPYFGQRDVEIVEASLMVIALSFTLYLPRERRRASEQYRDGVTSTQSVKLPRKIYFAISALLISIFMQFIFQGVGWSFSMVAATPFHLSESTISNALTISAVLQLPCALIVAWLGVKAGIAKPLIISTILVLLMIWGLFFTANSTVFVIALALSAVPGTIAYPYLLGLLSDVDTTGRSAALAGGFVNFGGAAGPAIGGVFFSMAGLAGVGWSCFALIGFYSLFLIIGASTIFRKAKLEAALIN
ncbi:MFS transporter [Mangrovibacter yixingensis]|uniref:MFS transporter n=1 Tax=Mangrovibacter yixingensis TaxID=1529639 RepID=UPI001CFAF6A3|nr:MFS transporter [Mangrovibacter yixingensis]